jgi:HEAT repeats
MAMMTFVLRCLGVALVLSTGMLLTPNFAFGQGSSGDIAELAKRLRSSDDFRVRTQAALALGATGDPNAVRHLCDALKDQNAAVRTAAAAALGRTGPKGVGCLKAQLKEESVKYVQAALHEALTRLTPVAPTIDGATKYYIAIGEVTNDSGRKELGAIVRKSLTKYFAKVQGVVIAPENESPAQAKALLSKHSSVKSFCVWPKIKMTYDGASLKLKLDLSLLTYPDKAFRGSAARSMTMPDVAKPDVAAEDELIDMAAGMLVPDVQQQAPRI